MDLDSARSLLKRAREQLIAEGMPFPEIQDEDIYFDKKGEPFLAFDFDINEEHLYRSAMIRMEQVIFELQGKTWIPMEKGFYLVFDDNYSKDVPKKWYVKSKSENMNLTVNDSGVVGKTEDAFHTYDNDNTFKPPAESTYQQKIHEEKVSESPKEIVDGDTDFPDTYSNMDLPDTY